MTRLLPTTLAPACQHGGEGFSPPMQQCLHLLIVDCRRGAALATRYGSRWLLPLLSCPERVRVDSSIARWTSEQGICGEVAGHWLGRTTSGADSMDWLVAIPARPGSCAANPDLVWTPLDALRSDTSLLEYQHWAVATALQGGALPTVRGPFGNLTWLAEVKAWIRASVGDWDPTSITPYRVTAHEVVLSARTSRGTVYFKGLASDRAVEARLTQMLSARMPDTFARTLALEAKPDSSVWWLAAECSGHTMRRCPPGMAASNVPRALARVQRSVMASAPVLRELREVDLASAAAWAAGLLSDGISRAAIARACDEAGNADVPQSWIPLDLDPGNVLVDDSGGVRFIDLDDSFVGPAPLAMADFARQCRHGSAYGAYEDAWSPALKGVSWPGFELASAVLEAWLGWKRVERNTYRGEVYGVSDLAAGRLAKRLAAVIHRL